MALNAVSPGVSAMVLLEHALDEPIPQRCSIIERILIEFNSKELHGVLPLLIESLFNFNRHPRGWSIHRIDDSGLCYKDFKCVQNLLHPTKGSLLQVIYKLTSDSTCKYEFPLSFLPLSTQLLIEEGNIPPFYLDKVQFSLTGKATKYLSLNAFEYYMFHFVYFVVNQNVSKAAFRTYMSGSNALYPTLVEEYLNCFFPLDSSNPPFVQPASGSPRSPFHPAVLHNRLRPFQSPSSNVSTFGRTSLPRVSGLIKVDAQVLMPQTLAMPNEHGWIEKETWMSEALLQIFVEFWLNHSSGRNTDQCYQTNTVTSFSAEHVQLVRLLVKHLHLFVSTLRMPIHSPHRPLLLPCWDEFKGLIWPHYVQKKLYRFLRYNFERWPLDASFYVVLETWLSFIQPWRYSFHQGTQNCNDADAKNQEVKDVEDKWRQFVSDHLPFYSVLFHSFLDRAFRLDLTSDKNAFMLFRVSKILCLPNLQGMLLDAENMMQHPYGHSLSHQPGDPLMNSSYRSIAGHSTSIALQVSDLEGSQFQYQPLFSSNMQILIKQLLKIAGEALEAVRIQIAASERASTSWFDCLNFFTALDFKVSGGYDESSENAMNCGTDNKKIVSYLEQGIANLSFFFQIPVQPVATQPSLSSVKKSPHSYDLPDTETTESGTALTPRGRYQMINGLRKFDISYQGDPELQPIRSFESAFLVRLLYSITNFVNTRFASQVMLFSERHDFVGRMVQHLLSPSSITSKPIRLDHLSPDARQRVESFRQPRLSLRWLASYKVIGFLVTLLLLVKFRFDVGFVAAFTILIFLCILFLMAKTLFCHSPNLAYA